MAKLSVVFFLCCLPASIWCDSIISTCSKLDDDGQPERFVCPNSLDFTKRYCCGLENQQYCCTEEEHQAFVVGVGVAVIIILAVLAVIIFSVCVLICCCCCSCCYLAQRRQRHQTIIMSHPLQGVVTVTTDHQPIHVTSNPPPNSFKYSGLHTTEDDKPPPYQPN